LRAKKREHPILHQVGIV